jgi:hypothetical protein
LPEPGNDAIAAIPFGRAITSFYENNTGKAKITISEWFLRGPLAAADRSWISWRP